MHPLSLPLPLVALEQLICSSHAINSGKVTNIYECIARHSNKLSTTSPTSRKWVNCQLIVRSSVQVVAKRRTKKCDNRLREEISSHSFSLSFFLFFGVTEGAFLRADASDETDAISRMPWTPASGQRSIQRETKLPSLLVSSDAENARVIEKAQSEREEKKLIMDGEIRAVDV